MIQYSMDASCFSGSAVNFRQTRAVCDRLWTAIPASTMLRPSLTDEREDNVRARITAQTAPANAEAVTAMELDRKRMPNAAPALAPEDTPMISGEASGFLNTV